MEFTVKDYDPSMKECFEEMFSDYNFNDLKMQEAHPSFTEELLREKVVNGLFIKNHMDGVSHVSVAFLDGSPAGFVCWQVDSAGSDWCRRPGWGFIREFYIRPELRRRGLGRRLAQWTESRLREVSEKLYLTSDGGIPFWEALGWRDTGEINENGTHTMEKD